MPSYSVQREVSNGTLTLLSISIEYFDRSEISVYFDGVVNARQWAWVGTVDKALSFTPAVANGVEVSVRRSTDISVVRHDFVGGAAFTDPVLDENFKQVLHIAQEAKEGSTLGDLFQDLDFHGNKAVNVGAGSAAGDAVNVGQLAVHDSTIIGYRDAAAASAAAAALSAADAEAAIGQPADNSVTTAKIASGAVTLDKLDQTLFHGATAKAAPVDADELSVQDSAAAFVLKRTTWANIKAVLKTHFDTLYAVAGNYLPVSGGIVTGNLGVQGTLGFAAGAGGTVTQLTNKSTAVTLNKVTGRITTAADALAGNTTVFFTLNNSVLNDADILQVNLKDSVAADGTYQVWVTTVGTGLARIAIRNITGSSASSAIAINFAVVRGSLT